MLPICEKIHIEKVTFDKMFGFLIENKLISSNQSGSKPGDSYIKQLNGPIKICKKLKNFLRQSISIF